MAGRLGRGLGKAVLAATVRGVALALALPACTASAAPIHTTYLWHMHQPIYWPDLSLWEGNAYEKAYETIVLGHSQSDESEIFGKADRIGDYQWYPRDALNSIRDLPDAGAQVSFAGSLIENVTSLGANGWNGGVYAPDWYHWYREARGWTTSGGRPRCDMVLVGHHHAINPLMDENAFRKEIQVQKAAYPQAWGTSDYSVGFFPAETCFSERLIPVLEDEGVDWAIVPDVHVARACQDYPYTANQDNCDPPNPADQVNPPQGYYYGIYISRGVTVKVPPPFGFRPHFARYVDPATGEESRVVVVPAANALSWDEGYGLYGTGQIDAIASYNDPSRPMLMLFAHDGDNAWAGGYSYWYENVTQFSHAAASHGYEPTVVAEYLADHPVDPADVVHVEDGGWVNADGDFGSPQFINWNWPLHDSTGGFDIPNGWALDERNWAVLTAAENRVETAEAVAGYVDPVKIQKPSLGASDAEKAWHFLLAGYESGYMYYGSALDFEIKPTLACNNAVAYADPVIAGGTDTVAPTIWLPQRLPWNPGGYGGGSLWGYPGGSGAVMTQDFHVWTFVYDVSGVESVVLKYREDDDGANPMSTDVNETYAGGAGVGAWEEMAMAVRDFPAGNVWNDPGVQFSEMPVYVADQYTAHVTGFESVLLDYYIEATDSLGHVKRSPIQHVWVGSGGGGPDPCVWWDPVDPEAGDTLTVSYDLGCRGVLPPATNPVRIHVGHSGWQGIVTPDPAMVWDAQAGAWTYAYAVPVGATSVDFVFNDGAGHWDNNGGADWHVTVIGASGPGFVMDGQLDAGAELVSSGPSLSLHVGFDGTWLYLATQGVGSTTGLDHFVLTDLDPSGSRSAPWAKAGAVAGWDHFLGNEDSNNWSGWFDASEAVFGSSAALKASGVYLEGALDLVALYGAVPESLCIAVAGYGTQDGASLATQVPAGNGNGNVEHAEYYVWRTGDTGAPDAPLEPASGGFKLCQNAPNPFSPETVVEYEVPEGGAIVTVKVFDVSGRLVRTLVDGPAAGGVSRAAWDGCDAAGRALPAGVYFVRMAWDGGQTTRKTILIK